MRSISSHRLRLVRKSLPEGHYFTTRNNDPMRYVVVTENRINTYTSIEFEKKYGWKNDPSKVIIRPTS